MALRGESSPLLCSRSRVSSTTASARRTGAVATRRAKSRLIPFAMLVRPLISGHRSKLRAQSAARRPARGRPPQPNAAGGFKLAPFDPKSGVTPNYLPADLMDSLISLAERRLLTPGGL